MNDAIFCLAAFMLLGWVIYLKYKIGWLHNEIEVLKEKLKRVIRKSGETVEPGDDRKVWEQQRPPWLN